MKLSLKPVVLSAGIDAAPFFGSACLALVLLLLTLALIPLTSFLVLGDKDVNNKSSQIFPTASFCFWFSRSRA